ncbi:MAG: hypothetical protein ACE5H4_11140 [Candidatus Thorarchaeota archaeon]
MKEADMTKARVLEIKEGKAITLPGEFVEGIKQQFGLAILVMKDNNVKLYPVDDKEVMYLKLEIEKLSKSFLEELTTIFMKAGLDDILFTSGICQAADQCYYECYFTPKQLNLSVKELDSHLNGIVGVQKVVLHQVPIG